MSPALVVVVGPIAAGKSTLAAEVGRRLRARGESVAVVGLDSVAEMALPGLDWDWAHEVHGQLVRAWLTTPVDTVVAEGPSTREELDRLLQSVPGDVEVLTVVLATPYAVAVERAQRDPARGLSKDPEFLRRDRVRFEGSRPELEADLVLDGGSESASVLAERVVGALRDPPV